MVRCLLLLAGLLHVVAAQATALAAEEPRSDRSLGEQPTYQTKAPGYALLSFGEGKADRVWLVWDGNTLYVDRIANGDLTDPADRIAAQPQSPGSAADGSYTFEVGELLLGGRTHKGLAVTVAQLAQYEGGSLGQRADVQAILRQNSSAVTFTVSLDAEAPGLSGGGIGGRLSYRAGPVDLAGVLQFGNQPQAAPVIKIGGPHVITFFAERPSLRVGRASDFVLVVGSPGEGPGTLAMLAYDGTIPPAALPTADISFPPAKPGDAPVREKFEIKERC